MTTRPRHTGCGPLIGAVVPEGVHHTLLDEDLRVPAAAVK